MTDKPKLTRADLVVGATYRAKRPRQVGTVFNGGLNDRTILWIGLAEVQYDGPAVANGRKYPRVMISDFLKWAGEKL
jgi:hypothetical protein